MKPLLLFGGTFDPVHRGHVAVAGEVARAIGEPVHLMPVAVPPHRETPGADATERLHMLRLAVEGHPDLRVDDRELRRDGPSWTVETLRQIRHEIGERQPVVILVGADAFAKFDTWRDWREILDLAHVLVLTRPGAGAEWSPALHRVVKPRLAESIDTLRGGAAG
ncbi:MAG TPA: nicotinate-nucleotide adenylyltransferase, partial [Xanthomonadaceae bacterium]|nr:nicotinate-nucleotide adenylyltransferase [Xanthomonadaceae bacterium]